MNVTEAITIVGLLGCNDPRVTPGGIRRAACVLADEVARLTDELARIRTDHHAQLEAVHDLTETLAEERVQHAAQMERVRAELAGTAARIAAWDDALGDVVPELEREMDARPRLVGP